MSRTNRDPTASPRKGWQKGVDQGLLASPTPAVEGHAPSPQILHATPSQPVSTSGEFGVLLEWTTDFYGHPQKQSPLCLELTDFLGHRMLTVKSGTVLGKACWRVPYAAARHFGDPARAGQKSYHQIPLVALMHLTLRNAEDGYRWGLLPWEPDRTCRLGPLHLLSAADSCSGQSLVGVFPQPALISPTAASLGRESPCPCMTSSHGPGLDLLWRRMEEAEVRSSLGQRDLSIGPGVTVAAELTSGKL